MMTKSRKILSVLLFLFWFGISILSKDQPIVSIIVFALLGVIAGIDGLISPEASVLYQWNKKWYSPDTVQIAAIFMIFIFSLMVLVGLLNLLAP